MRAPRTTRLSLALGIALGMAATAQAQQIPNIGDAVRQVPPPAVPATPPPLPALSGAPGEAPMHALPDGGPVVQVTRFSFAGNRAIDSATLLALLQDAQNKSLSLAQLDAQAARVTHYYRARGYFVARAYIPAQEVQGGTITIRVVEGHYGKFALDNRSRVRDDVVQALLDNIRQRSDTVSLDGLEHALLTINDTPGVQVRQADVLPGETVGSSDFAIATQATPSVGGYLLVDNYGSTYTGKERLGFSADWNSPTGRGDRLSATGLVTRSSDLLNGRLAYSALVAADGTRAEVALSRTTYALAGVYAPLDASGTANGAELRFSKPLQRTRNDSVLADVTFQYRGLRDEVRATGTAVSKRLASVQFGIARNRDHALAGLAGLSTVSAALTVGHLHFEDPVAKAQDAVGARTQGSYGKLNFAANRVSLLPAQLALTTGVRAQAALGHKNLDGVERMSVSGAGAVAAYPIGEWSADHAVLARVELARPLPMAGPVQLGVSVFADYGWARMASAPAGQEASRTLGDIGAGLSARAGGALLKLQVVRRTHGGTPTSESAAKTRVLVQAGWVL